VDRFRVLLLIWLLFMVLASLLLPAYNGGTGGGGVIFVVVWLAVAGLALVGVRGRAQSARNALLSTLPAIALLAAAPVIGDMRNEDLAQFRGGPLFLYYGVALWASWAALMLSTALLARTKWSGFAGIGLGLLVAWLGFVLFTTRLD
jgi:hypothetical protein